jgi:hypothetical protein
MVLARIEALIKANVKEWKFTIEPEWTARATPQSNLLENPIYICTMKQTFYQSKLI